MNALLLGDALGYSLWAQEIARGDWIGTEVFYQAPLYPYFVAVVYALFGIETTAIRVVQALLGSASCVLIALAGNRIADRRVGLLAGALLALYPAAIYFDSAIQKPSLDVLLCSALILLLARASGRLEPLPWLWTGAAVGVLSLNRENALMLTPLLAFWILAAEPPRGGGRRIAALVAGAVLMLSPALARNWVVGGGFHLTTSQLGPNLYIGNHEGANGMYSPLVPGRGSWRYEREDARRLAEQALARPLTSNEVSGYWAGRALDWARSDPVGCARLLMRKLAMTLNRVEIADTEGQYLFALWSVPLRALGPLLHFGTLLPFAVIGVVIGWRRPPVRLLALLGSCLAASVALFFVFARYRSPIVPILIVLAAVGIVGIADRARSSGLRGMGPWLVAGSAAAVVANLPLVSREQILAECHYNLGVVLAEAGRIEEASQQYRASIEAFPLASAHVNLGNLEARSDRLEEARRLFAAAVSIDPDHPGARVNLGRALAGLGRPHEAVEHYEEAARLAPEWSRPRRELGELLLAAGRVEQAVVALREAVRLAPTDANLRINLGRALARSGQLAAARRMFEEAVRLAPRSAAAHQSLGHACEVLGDLRAAIRHYEEVARLRPSQAAAGQLARARGRMAVGTASQRR